LIGCANLWLKKEAYKDEPKCFWATDSSKSNTDYGIIYYENNSTWTLDEEINFDLLKGYELMFPFKGNKANVIVEPG